MNLFNLRGKSEIEFACLCVFSCLSDSEIVHEPLDGFE